MAVPRRNTKRKRINRAIPACAGKSLNVKEKSTCELVSGMMYIGFVKAEN